MLSAPGWCCSQSRVLADTSSSGTSSDACAGADVEEETGSVDEQATRKEDVTNALTLRKIGSFILGDYVESTRFANEFARWGGG